jgi:Zn-dependent metalloprotease
MGRHGAWSAATVLVGCLATGCMGTPDARYVYQDGEYGVIGIPKNSPYGKKNYHEQARELMTRHFPEGYEIVRAEEVVEGQRTLDTAIKKEVETDPSVNALNQALRVGKFATSSSLDQKDTLQITESRIIYKRKDPRKPSELGGYTKLATIQPELYIDPNDAMRKGITIALKELEQEKLLADLKRKDDKTKPDKPKDSDVMKASADGSKSDAK